MTPRRAETIHELGGGDHPGTRLRRRAVRALQAQDRLYPLVVRLRPRAHLLAVPTTDLVIEGAPRSANTFLVAACDRLNPGLQLAHHMHTSSQVKRAARWDTPCLVVIREPLDAATSMLVWSPDRRPAEVLTDWIRFYRRCLPLHGHFVAVGFEEATEDPGRVFARVNRRFATQLETAYDPAVDREPILADVEERARRFDGQVFETRVGRPSDSDVRRRRRDAAREALGAAGLAGLRSQAGDLYERYRPLLGPGRPEERR